MPGIMSIFLAIAGFLLFVVALVLFRFGILWVQAQLSGVPVSLFELVGMYLRRTDPAEITRALIAAKHAGLDISCGRLQAHALARGSVTAVIEALIAAKSSGREMSFDAACVADLASHGRESSGERVRGEYDAGRTDPHDPLGNRAERQDEPHPRAAPKSPLLDTVSRAPFEIIDLNALPATPCPCGVARRAFLQPGNMVASVHRVDISADAKAHYHKHLTEIYYFLECGQDAKMELNGELHPVKPGMAVMIRPGTRHRAVGRMKIVNVVVPPFDKNDEWFD